MMWISWTAGDELGELEELRAEAMAELMVEPLRFTGPGVHEAMAVSIGNEEKPLETTGLILQVGLGRSVS